MKRDGGSEDGGVEGGPGGWGRVLVWEVWPIRLRLRFPGFDMRIRRRNYTIYHLQRAPRFCVGADCYATLVPLPSRLCTSNFLNSSSAPPRLSHLELG